MILIGTEKVFDKIQHPFMIETLKMRLKDTYLNITKNIYDKPIANIILNSERLKEFTLRSGTRQGLSLHPINTVLEVLSRASRKEKN